MIPSPEQDAERLISVLRPLRRVAVAFSGGVDSSVVAAAAFRSQLESVIAVTADSPSVPRWQLELAVKIAREIGIEHHVLPTDEVDRASYRRNDSRRCFFCKETLYTSLTRFLLDHEPNLLDHQSTTIVSGTNAEDLGDYRPGIEAGNQAKVVTPLADLGLSKHRVRALAALFGLSNGDLPASPCLASRIAYGLQVTPERLRQIEQAEDWLRHNGMSEFRVRLHPDQLARIEVPKSQISEILKLDVHGDMTREFRSYGFQFVTIDLEGFRSGSLNRVLVSIGSCSSSQSREAAH